MYKYIKDYIIKKYFTTVVYKEVPRVSYTYSTVTKEVVRLREDVYNTLVKQCPSIVVDDKTGTHYAGYMLGVQFVLNKLRQGIVE
jgi:thioredoxin-related protein